MLTKQREMFMKVVVFQGKPVSNDVKRDELVKRWKTLLRQNGIDCRIVGTFDPEYFEDKIEDADALIGAWIKDDMFDTDFFIRHPKLKYIATTAHGYGKIDPKTIDECGVTYTNTVYGNHTIAEYAMALLLETMHHIQKENDLYHKELELGIALEGTCTTQMELYEKTVGVIGLGGIGYAFAKMANGFDTHVLSYSRHKKVGEKYDFIEQVSLDELLERSDVISIHCPLTEETFHMINKEAIEKMKDGVIIINTARGDIIDEEALYDALMKRKIYAAGLDVVSGEPRSSKSKIFYCNNALITRHIAWLPKEARFRAIDIAVDNLVNWMQGHPTSVIR